LPKYGGRSWQVAVRVHDSAAGSPLFRWYRGKLELAALPHILEKIPDPPNFPGYKQTEYGVVRHLVKTKHRKRQSIDGTDINYDKSSSSSSSSDEESSDDEGDEEEIDVVQFDLTPEELSRMESLVGRDVSTLSQVAWDNRNNGRHAAPLPTISIKWTCPLRQHFTTRKAAWDHALSLAKAEQFVDRFLRGLGKSGVELKPFRPTKAQALQAGKVRFLRDGLWVVGQEQNWQNDRYWKIAKRERKAQKQAEKRQQQQEEEEEQGRNWKRTIAVIDENGEPLKKRRKITGPMLFIAVHRVAYREQRLQELKQELQNQPKSKDATDSKNDGIEAAADTATIDNNTKSSSKVSKTAAKVGMPECSDKKPSKRKSSNQKVSFTLTDAEKELRNHYKATLTDDEQYMWDVRALSSFQRKLDEDDHARFEQTRQEQVESESENEEEESENDEEEEKNIQEEKKDEEQAKVDGVTEVSATADQEMTDADNDAAGGHDASEESSYIQLATEQERKLWELLSQAEMNYWKSEAMKTLPGSKQTTTVDPVKSEKSFDVYQAKVYNALFGMTQAEYIKEAVKVMRATERRSYLKLVEDEKELVANGMKQIHKAAYAILEKRIDKWVTSGISGALRKEKNAKKAAASATPEAAFVATPASTAIANSTAKPQTTYEALNCKPSKPSSLVQSLQVAPPLSVLGIPMDASAIEAINQKNSHFSFAGSFTTSNSTLMVPPGVMAQNNDMVPSAGFNSVPAASAANAATPISPSPTLGDPQNGVKQSVVAQPKPNEVSAAASLVEPEKTLSKPDCSNAEGKVVVGPASTPFEENPAAVPVATPDENVSDEEKSECEEVPLFVPTFNYCLNESQIKLCRDASMEHFDAVMRTVKAKDLTRELADGFDVLRERCRGRYDMELPAFELPQFDFLNDIQKAPWMPIVRQVLGDDVVLIHKGCFLSLPDASNQPYHQDGPHLHTTAQKPCHAVNVFTPLVDMTMQHGPTEFCLGSHVLGQEDWDRRYLETPLSKKGVPIMFDYRLGHRGLANTSKEPRPVVYCTYARAGDGKEFRDSVNFSRRRYRKIGDLVDKPLTREERNHRRQAQMDETWQTIDDETEGKEMSADAVESSPQAVAVAPVVAAASSTAGH